MCFTGKAGFRSVNFDRVEYLLSMGEGRRREPTKAG